MRVPICFFPGPFFLYQFETYKSFLLFFASHLFSAGTRSWTAVLGTVHAKVKKGRFYRAFSRQRNHRFYWSASRRMVGGVAKSKPCSLRAGLGSAGGGGLTWHVGGKSATWW